MSNLTNAYSSLTKQESLSVKKMTLLKKYKSLLKNAHYYKSLYLELKGKDSLKLDDKNKNALISLMAIHKKDALDFWLKSEELKKNNPFLEKYL